MGRAALVLLVLAGGACSPAVTQKVITPADLADPPRTRITAMLGAPLRDGATTEEYPSTIKPEAIADEVVIKRLASAEVCFEVTTRTAIALDAPLAAWRTTVDGQDAKLDGEAITVRDYPCTGEAPVTVAEGLSQQAFVARGIGEPKAIAFRVVERRASGCFPRAEAKAKRVRLSLTLPARDGKGDWHEVFEWRVQE